MVHTEHGPEVYEAQKAPRTRTPYGNWSACCGGLTFPNQPHLHAEDCPECQKPAGEILFREDRAEREQFDMNTDMFGHPLRQIAATLDTWGRMAPGGSYSQQCFIMANECIKAAALLSDGALGRQGKPLDAVPGERSSTEGITTRTSP